MSKKPAPPSLLSPLIAGVVMFSAFIVLVLPNLGSSNKSVVETAKTYISVKNHLSFIYPLRWEVSETSSEIQILQPGSIYSLTITTLDNVPDTGKYISGLEKNDYFTVEPDSQIKIGALKTLALIDTTGSGTQYMLYAADNGFVYHATFLSDNPERTTAITRLLSTFKFSY